MIDMRHAELINRVVRGVIGTFDNGDWQLLAMYLGDYGVIITGHDRLLRSLHFGDEDYPSCVASVIGQLYNKDPDSLALVEKILADKGVENGSHPEAENEKSVNPASAASNIDFSTAAVMIPFAPQFTDVRKSMAQACQENNLTLKAADDVWEEAILIDDIMRLIRTACIVIVDFSGKNPNVMYETGVAHALGKEVIPVSQSIDDVPFDVKHHRVLLYENNEAGREALRKHLASRIKTILDRNGWYAPF